MAPCCCLWGWGWIPGPPMAGLMPGTGPGWKHKTGQWTHTTSLRVRLHRGREWSYKRQKIHECKRGLAVISADRTYPKFLFYGSSGPLFAIEAASPQGWMAIMRTSAMRREVVCKKRKKKMLLQEARIRRTYLPDSDFVVFARCPRTALGRRSWARGRQSIPGRRRTQGWTCPCSAQPAF